MRGGSGTTTRPGPRRAAPTQRRWAPLSQPHATSCGSSAGPRPTSAGGRPVRGPVTVTSPAGLGRRLSREPDATGALGGIRVADGGRVGHTPGTCPIPSVPWRRTRSPPGATGCARTASRPSASAKGAPPRDFYAAVASDFRADPRRDGRARARPAALAGEARRDVARHRRRRRPLRPSARAARARTVIAVEPSEGMQSVLRHGMAEHGHLERPTSSRRAGRWRRRPTADVALIAHIGYDIEEIGSFLDAMEASARRFCVAVLVTPSPPQPAERFWPPIHGEARVLAPFAHRVPRAAPGARSPLRPPALRARAPRARRRATRRSGGSTSSSSWRRTRPRGRRLASLARDAITERRWTLGPVVGSGAAGNRHLAPARLDHGSLSGELASNSIVPGEPSPLVYAIASRPTLKPKVRAPPSCSRNRASTDDCRLRTGHARAGQRSHCHFAGHRPTLDAREVTVATARPRETTSVIGERDDRLRSGWFGDIPRAQCPHGPSKRGHREAARPHGAERVQPAVAERPLPVNELAGAARRVVCSRSHRADEKACAIDAGRSDLHAVPQRSAGHVVDGAVLARDHCEKRQSSRTAGPIREHDHCLVLAVAIEVAHDAKAVRELDNRARDAADGTGGAPVHRPLASVTAPRRSSTQAYVVFFNSSMVGASAPIEGA